MAWVLRNAIVTFDSTDISSLLSQVEVAMTAADVNTTAMGAGGQQHLAGIRDDRITFTAFSDFTASGLHSLVQGKLASSSAGTAVVIIYPNQNGQGAVVGTNNPRFTANCSLLTYTPIGGAVGDAATTPLELPVNGSISVVTA